MKKNILFGGIIGILIGLSSNWGFKYYKLKNETQSNMSGKNKLFERVIKGQEKHSNGVGDEVGFNNFKDDKLIDKLAKGEKPKSKKHKIGDRIKSIKVRVINGGNGGRAIIFGRNKYGTAPYGATGDVSVTAGLNGVNYSEVINQLAVNPIIAKGFRIIGKNELVYDSKWTYVYKDANGQMLSIPIDMERYHNPNNYTSNVLDVPLKIELNGFNYIQVDMPKTKGKVSLNFKI